MTFKFILGVVLVVTLSSALLLVLCMTMVSGLIKVWFSEREVHVRNLTRVLPDEMNEEEYSEEVTLN